MTHLFIMVGPCNSPCTLHTSSQPLQPLVLCTPRFSKQGHPSSPRLLLCVAFFWALRLGSLESRSAYRGCVIAVALGYTVGLALLRKGTAIGQGKMDETMKRLCTILGFLWNSPVPSPSTMGVAHDALRHA